MEKDPFAFKALFLGPKSENQDWVRQELEATLNSWFEWRKSLFTSDPSPISEEDKNSREFLKQRSTLSETLNKLNTLLRAETPKYSPRYIGHMVSELSLPAILGHFATLLHNPNNTSKEVAKVGSTIEKEAIGMLASMVGFKSIEAKGHFTCGGTIANFEAIWRARFRYDHWMSLALCLAEEHKERLYPFKAAHMGWARFKRLIASYGVTEPIIKNYSSTLGNTLKTSFLISKHIKQEFLGPVILVPGNKHFSWQKGVNIFGFGEEAFWTVPVNKHGKLDLRALKALVKKAETEHRPILLIVSVAGTTETGEIDPIDKVQDYLDELRENKGINIWHHVDAAYGGFMCPLLKKKKNALSAENRAALRAVSRASSVTLDPHKLGYVPYSCGAFLVPNQNNYSVSSFQAPYLDRPELGKGKWSSTIEGSRTAAGATATWLTGKSVGFNSPVFANVVDSTLNACQTFAEKLKKVPWVHLLDPIETNILCFSIASEGDSLQVTNKKTLGVFNRFVKSPNFAVSRTTLGVGDYELQIKEHLKKFNGKLDSDHLTLIRCVFMNPFWEEENVQKKLIPEFLSELETHHKNVKK